MIYKTRAHEIAALQKKYGKGRGRHFPVAFPDLKCESNVAPMSNNMAVKFSSQRRGGCYHPDAKEFPIGNSHKQGPQLVTPAQFKNGELRYMGGGKPK